MWREFVVNAVSLSVLRELKPETVRIIEYCCPTCRVYVVLARLKPSEG